MVRQPAYAAAVGRRRPGEHCHPERRVIYLHEHLNLKIIIQSFKVPINDGPPFLPDVLGRLTKHSLHLATVVVFENLQKGLAGQGSDFLRTVGDVASHDTYDFRVFFENSEAVVVLFKELLEDEGNLELYRDGLRLTVAGNDGTNLSVGAVVTEGPNTFVDLLNDKGICVLSLLKQFDENALQERVHGLLHGLTHLSQGDHGIFGQTRP